MTIGQFYDANPARRSSSELKFGDRWSTSAEPGCDYAVFWVEDAGEHVAMRAPHAMPFVAGRFAGLPPYGEADYTVEVLGVLNSAQVGAVTAGWQLAMPLADSLSWLRARVDAALRAP
jgi:hypothetical protein